jgi:two-component system OmpR family response regulator
MTAPRVLIVEDSITIAAAIRSCLGAAFPGIEIAASTTEDHAVEQVRAQHFGLVVIDLQLAQGTGFGVIRAAKDSRPKSALLVFTNHAVPALKVAAFEAGADYFLDKAKGIPQIITLARELLPRFETPTRLAPGGAD